MAYGIFHRRIFLPEIEYSEEEIDIILHHELIHHKHHDLLWKVIFYDGSYYLLVSFRNERFDKTVRPMGRSIL